MSTEDPNNDKVEDQNGSADIVKPNLPVKPELDLFSGLTEKPPEDIFALEECAVVQINPVATNTSMNTDEIEPTEEQEENVKIETNNAEATVKCSAIKEEKPAKEKDNDTVLPPAIQMGEIKELHAPKEECKPSDTKAPYAEKPIKSPIKQKKTPVVEPMQPSIRRSSRANKGVGKEIFDPSYIPKSKMPSLEPPKRSCSPVSDTSLSSPTVGKGRPKKTIHAVQDSFKHKTTETPDSSKKENKKQLNTKPISRVEFSDEDDNVPLQKILKQEEEEDVDYKAEEEPTEESDPDISDEDEDVDSDDSYNNPDRLWCICKKPHDNRFMISCDKCEEWFHGDCVGITLLRGKKMEEIGEEYVCPQCVQERSKKSPNKENSLNVKRQSSKEETKETHGSGALKRKPSADSHKPGRSLKTFALKGQIQQSSRSEDGVPQRKKLKIFKEKNSKKSDKRQGEKKASKSPVTLTTSGARKCIVTSCDNPALSGSVYCSNQCILRHAKESLKSLAKDKETSSSAKPKSMKKESNFQQHKDQKDRVPVHCRKTNKVLTGSSAPYRRDLAAFLKANPSYEVYRPRSKPSPNQEKTPIKSEHGDDSSKSVASLDFYRHVEHQNRKRDRYGTDPDYAPPLKKPSDGEPSVLEKKHKTALNVVRVSSVPQTTLQTSKTIKPRRDSGESSKRSESSLGAKPSSFSDKPDASKVQRRKWSGSDSSSSRKSTEDRPQKKMERSSHSQSSKSESKSTSSFLSSSSSQGSSSDIRQNVKKTLLDILSKRSEASDDLKMHRSSIARLATKVEESLFKVFGDTNMKYKNKYRSIMFNLKDARNHGLWRKVIIGDVTTSELVQMTAEQMASKKLAEWRQMELTQGLDIIEKQEKEEGNVRPIAKITHKGEIAIQEDLSDLTATCYETRDTAKNPTVAPVRKKRISLSEDDPFDPSFLSSPDDTTLQHKEHLFDLNCKICTGKVKEEEVEFPAEPSKKVKSSSSIILSSEAQKSSFSSALSPTAPAKNSAAPTSHLFKADKSKKMKKHKASRKQSDSRSHDPSLSPSSFLHKISTKSPSQEQKIAKKTKPVLPAPPPLSDLAPHVEEETVEKSEVVEVTPPKDTPEKGGTPPLQEEQENNSPPSPVQEVVEAAPVKKVSKSSLIWSGSISMLELTTFKANVYPVTGNCENLDIDLPLRLVLGGRIHPKVVWDYLLKVKALPTKQLSIIRFHAASDDDRVGYVAMLSYFSSRKRFGVVSNQDRMLVKDMYLIPLLESQAIPEELMRTQDDDLDEVLPANRPSMLLGIIVRQAPKHEMPGPEVPEVAKLKKPEPILSFPPKPNETVVNERATTDKKVSMPLTDEQIGAASTTVKSSGSLLERNKSLAPSLRFFMRKASEEKQSEREQENGDQPYSPGAQVVEEENEGEGGDYDPEDTIGEHDDMADDEPYDPEQEEEYDPETAFVDKEEEGTEDDAPYDPEQEEELLKKQSASEVDQLVEKQAYLERMQRELEEKKAKLAEVEETLQQSAAVVVEQRVDPRMARRAAAQAQQQAKEETPAPAPVSSTTSEPPKNPLQTILSVLNMSANSSSATAASNLLSSLQQKQPVKKDRPSSPPPLPDSTTKSDVEETPDLRKEKGVSLVAYASTPDSNHDDITGDDVRRMDGDEKGEKRNKKKDDRRRRSMSSSSTSSREGGHRRRRLDSQGHHDDRRHRKSGRRSRSPSGRSRRHHHESSRQPHRRHDDEYRGERRSWSRDRRR